ncbi:MAG: DNA polymerase III subunit gamma/tau [Deltaproteobacteria bacterium]|nr:DNA polymerase III subunit gamma/tau [Deltaproteobacteria bacterium]
MSYQVLARKYRPQTFADVVGQEHVTVTLTNALATKRIHHAYLFTGARGVGKTTVARLLAKALNCEKGFTKEPCGTCRSCQEITNGNSLDVQEIDGASNTSVDDVREIREHVKFLPTSGKYKVYIIDEVHMLSTSAFNALLKTLEEPPAHVVFIFATTEAQKIPATILSRCQRYDFRRISASLAAEKLAEVTKIEKVTAEPEALHLMAREASGSMRDALSLCDQAIAFSGGKVTTEKVKAMLGFLDRTLLFDVVTAVVRHDGKRALALVDEIFAQGIDLNRLSLDLLEMLRHLVILKECGDDPKLFDLPSDELKRLVETAKQTTIEEVQQMFSLWYAGAQDIARSTFPKMLLEVLLLRLCRVEPVRPIGELMEKIEKLTNTSMGDHVVTKAPSGDALGRGDSRIAPTANDDQWLSLQRWLVANEPRIASLFQNGEFVSLDAARITMQFSNPLYADMLKEADRKQRVDQALTTFFKRKVELTILPSPTNGETKPSPQVKAERHREVTREVLESSVVRDATEILGAAVRDVKPLGGNG